MIMIWLSWCIHYISGQTTASLDQRSACSSSFWQCSLILSSQRFPVWQWSIPRWYPQWFSSPHLSTSWHWFLAFLIIQHSPHSYFHVIFISAYPAVHVQFYAYVQWFNFEQTNLLFAGKESSQQACDHRYNYTKGRNPRRNQRRYQKWQLW